MADRLKGITLEIGGDTTKLSSALSGVNNDIRETQTQLKDVERLLKLDPTNVDLLRQREKLLTDEIGSTKDKLEQLKQAQQTMDASGVDRNSAQYMALQREIIATEQELGNLETAADRANATLSKIGATADKVAAGANKVASATKGLSAAAAGALAGIGGMAYSAVTSADDLNTLAKQSGFTTAELQKMKYAQDLIDVSMEDITSSAQKLKKNMGSGSGGVADAFKQLGVSVTDSNGKMRSSTEVYWEVIDALGKVTNETERDQLAMTLLGKGADSLAGIIDDGGAAFRALGQEAEEAGLILSQDTLNSLNAVNDKIDSTKAKAQATLATSGAKAMEALMPVLDKVIDAIGRALEAIGNLDEGQIKMILTVLSVVAAISPVASLIGNVSSAVSFLSGTVLPALSGVLAFIAANPIVLLIAAIVALVALIATKGDEIQAALQKVDDFLQGIFTKDWTEVFGPVLGGVLNTFCDYFGGLWDSIKKVLDGVIDVIRGVFTEDWERVWTGVKEIFAGVFEGLYTVVMSPLNSIIGFFTEVIPAAWDSVVSFFQGIPDWWRGVWQSAADATSEKWNEICSNVVSGADGLQEGIQKVDDFLQGVFAKDWTEVFGPVLGGALNIFFDNVSGIWDGIKEIMDGVIETIKGVFSGDWEQAWNGIKDIFGGIFDAMGAYAKIPLNGIITLLNGIIDAANWCIEKLNQIPGVNFDTFGKIPFFANGGTLYRGSAVVGDAGPEILTVSGGKATVTPLTGSAGGSSPMQGGFAQPIQTAVNVQFTGSLSQLAAVLQPAISAETRRLGGSFAR